MATRAPRRSPGRQAGRACRRRQLPARLGTSGRCARGRAGQGDRNEHGWRGQGRSAEARRSKAPAAVAASGQWFRKAGRGPRAG